MLLGGMGAETKMCMWMRPWIEQDLFFLFNVVE